MLSKSMLSSICLAASIVFTGCNESTIAVDSKSNPSLPLQSHNIFNQIDYSTAVLRLKKEIQDPALRSKKVSELRSQFKIQDPEPTKEEAYIAERDTRTALMSLSEAVSSPSKSELSKAAAASVTLVKNYDMNFRKTYVGSASVSRFKTITITANAIGAADPFLVVWWDNGCGGCYGNTKIEDYDDDGAGGLNSVVTFTNNYTSSTLLVRFIVFSANAEAGIGNVNLVVNNNGVVTNINNVPARGVGTISDNVALPPCTTPYRSDIVSTPQKNYFAMNGGPSAFPIQGMRGAWNLSAQTSWWIPDYSVTSTPNFVVAYVTPSSSEVLGNLKQYDYCQ